MIFRFLNWTFLILIIAPMILGQTKTAAKIDEYFSTLASENWFNGSVLVAQNNKIILRKAYNISSNNQSQPVTIKSKVIIASVSKLFTKTSILKLAELKKFSLDDKLDKFIPDFPNGNKITIKNLLEHTSGLPRELKDYEEYESLSLEKIVELAKKEKLEFEPATRFLYSNIGYHLLQFIISKVESYPKFTVENILKPSKMFSTNEYNFAKPTKLFALGFSDDDEGNLKNIDEISINRTQTGNFYSTADDLFEFIKAIDQQKFLKPPFSEMMFDKDGILEHAGGRAGYRAWLHYNRQTKFEFIFLSNYSDIPFEAIRNDIPKIVFQKPYQIPQRTIKKAVGISLDVLQKYVGVYELEVDKTQKFKVLVEKGKLCILDKENNKTMFQAESEFKFFTNPKSADGIEFVPTKDGTKFDLVFWEGGRKIIAPKVD